MLDQVVLVIDEKAVTTPLVCTAVLLKMLLKEQEDMKNVSVAVRSADDFKPAAGRSLCWCCSM